MPIAEKCTKTSSPPSRSMKPDRKSTRLNSSHSQISYAVFCLKKKKRNHAQRRTRYRAGKLSSNWLAPAHGRSATQLHPSAARAHIGALCRLTLLTRDLLTLE